MNVALPAIIAFFIFLPGFILRAQLKQAERTSLDFSPFGQVVAEAVICSLLAHSVWLIFTSLLTHQSFDPLVMMKLLSGAPLIQESAAKSVADSFNSVVIYFVTLVVASFVLPKILREAIEKYRLDRVDSKFAWLFRLHDAPWYYLLTGADFPKDKIPSMIKVSAIVEVAKEAVLFVGVLDEYFLSTDGQLDRLVLQGVVRRSLAKDKSKDGAIEDPILADAPSIDRFYEIDGDYFVLRNSDIKTLNIEYVYLSPPQTESSIAAPD